MKKKGSVNLGERKKLKRKKNDRIRNRREVLSKKEYNSQDIIKMKILYKIKELSVFGNGQKNG